MLRLKNIKLNYHGQTALIIDELSAGDSFAVVGCAGSGKSSFLKVIAGLERIESGYIFIDGKEVGEFRTEKRNISLISARTPLKKGWSVQKNLVYPLKKYRFSKEQISSALTAVLPIIFPDFFAEFSETGNNIKFNGCFEASGNAVASSASCAAADKTDADKAGAVGAEEILKFLTKKAKGLTPQQQTRVLFARALIRNPKIILIDEPTEVISDMNLFCRLLREFAPKFIFATYDFSHAEMAADKFVILKGGNLIFCGDKQQLASCDNPYITKMCQ